jgi:general secretion pathway protein A
MNTTYPSFVRFFGLRANPFNVNPDPGYLFLNRRTQGVLDDLAGGIEARKGLMVLTGDVGTGKTILLNSLMQGLQRQKTPIAFVFNPGLQVRELFDLMLASFGVPARFATGASALLRLHQWLLERYRTGANAVLLIDEAQGLPAHVVEEIRMLLNQETPHEKLLQIILCGQPELDGLLGRAEMRQIRQRISVRCTVTALNLEDTQGYIQKRLQTAGAPSRNAAIFLPEAVEAVYFYSRGIPRVINLLCEHALMGAYGRQMRLVEAGLIDEAARQLQLEDAKAGVRPAPLRNGGERPDASRGVGMRFAAAAGAAGGLGPGGASRAFPMESAAAQPAAIGGGATDADATDASATVASAIGASTSSALIWDAPTSDATISGTTTFHPVAAPVASCAADDLEELARAAKELAENSSINYLEAPEVAARANRGLQVVRSPRQDARAASKLVEMPRDLGRRGEEARAAESAPRKQAGVSSHVTAGYVAARDGAVRNMANTIRAVSSRAADLFGRLRAKAFAEVPRWKGRAGVAMRELQTRLRPMREGMARWYGDAREYVRSVELENYPELLLRWLQRPMSTAKVQRRVRH